ncbi:hypothetical protein JW964_11745 [candidate division KSB1 bacterium]|nr:hypothetical protein [candidate division KSB1 bacterium]
MEFILFRLIQLMKRELLILDELQTCFSNSQAGFTAKNSTGNSECTRRPVQLILEIQQLELDKKEECLTIAKKLKLPLLDWSLCRLLKEVNQVMDHSNFLLVSLYNDLIALIRTTKNKNSSLQKYLYNHSFIPSSRKIAVIPDEKDNNWMVSSQKVPSSILVKKTVRINLN